MSDGSDCRPSLKDELRLGRVLEMSGQKIDEEGRDIERPAAGAGLGLLDVSDAAGDLLECPYDAHLTLQEVQMLSLKPDELAPNGGTQVGRTHGGKGRLIRRRPLRSSNAGARKIRGLDECERP